MIKQWIWLKLATPWFPLWSLFSVPTLDNLPIQSLSNCKPSSLILSSIINQQLSSTVVINQFYIGHWLNIIFYWYMSHDYQPLLSTLNLYSPCLKFDTLKQLSMFGPNPTYHPASGQSLLSTFTQAPRSVNFQTMDFIWRKKAKKCMGVWWEYFMESSMGISAPIRTYSGIWWEYERLVQDGATVTMENPRF